jgi:hypothetical protein
MSFFLDRGWPFASLSLSRCPACDLAISTHGSHVVDQHAARLICPTLHHAGCPYFCHDADCFGQRLLNKLIEISYTATPAMEFASSSEGGLFRHSSTRSR